MHVAAAIRLGNVRYEYVSVLQHLVYAYDVSRVEARLLLR